MANQLQTRCSGECIYDTHKLEYQVVSLELLKDKALKLEVICFNPNSFDKEAIFKYTTNNLSSADERLKIAMSIINSVVANLELDINKVHKLVVRNNKVFYIADV